MSDFSSVTKNKVLNFKLLTNIQNIIIFKLYIYTQNSGKKYRKKILLKSSLVDLLVSK